MYDDNHSRNEKMNCKGRIKKSVDDVFPLGYDSRRYARLILSGGGYVAQCQRDNSWLDAFKSALKLNVRDVSIRGLGLIGKTRLKSGDRFIIPSPQRFLMYANVVRCAPDPLFPTLYRIGLLCDEFPPVKVFLQWEPFLLAPQLPEFKKQLAILNGDQTIPIEGEQDNAPAL
jgi:hypothetical protein